MKSAAVFLSRWGGLPIFAEYRTAALFCRQGTVRKRFFVGGKEMADTKLTRADCLQLLIQEYDRLQAAGEHRYPRRDDFTDRQVVAIKAFLGPWPRALEAAGIKPPREVDRKEQNREKRIQAKRKRIAALKEEQAGMKNQKAESSP